MKRRRSRISSRSIFGVIPLPEAHDFRMPGIYLLNSLVGTRALRAGSRHAGATEASLRPKILFTPWRRFLTPETAAPSAYQLYCVRNAEDVNTGKRDPHELGVRALDDFTFQVDLSSPTPFFLGLITVYLFAAVPRQAIEAARQRGSESSWTEPQHMVVSGAFVLREWRRYESITAIRNPLYYEASLVELDELRFLPVSDGTTAVNLYRSGAVATMPGFSFPPLFTTALRRKKDFHAEPCFGTAAATISAQKPPLNNLLLRCALNMATEKKPFADLLGGGRIPASTVVPPIPGYVRPRILTS